MEKNIKMNGMIKVVVSVFVALYICSLVSAEVDIPVVDESNGQFIKNRGGFEVLIYEDSNCKDEVQNSRVQVSTNDDGHIILQLDDSSYGGMYVKVGAKNVLGYAANTDKSWKCYGEKSIQRGKSIRLPNFEVPLSKVKLDMVDDVKDSGGKDVAVNNGVSVSVYNQQGCEGTLLAKKETQNGSVTFTSKELIPQGQTALADGTSLYFKIEGKGYVTSQCDTKNNITYSAYVDGTKEEGQMRHNYLKVPLTLAKIKIKIQDEDGKDARANDKDITISVHGKGDCSDPPTKPTKTKDKQGLEVTFTSRDLEFPDGGTLLYFKISRPEFVEQCLDIAYKDGVEGRVQQQGGAAAQKVESGDNGLYTKLNYARIAIKLVDEDNKGIDFYSKITIKIYRAQAGDSPFDCSDSEYRITEISDVTIGGNSRLELRADKLRINDKPLPNNTYLFFQLDVPQSGYVSRQCPKSGNAEDSADLKYNYSLDGQKDGMDDEPNNKPDEDNNTIITIKYAKIVIKVVDSFQKNGIENARVWLKDLNCNSVEPDKKTDKEGVITFTSKELNFPQNNTSLFIEISHDVYGERKCQGGTTADIIYKDNIEGGGPDGKDIENDGKNPDEDNDDLIELEHPCYVLGKKILELVKKYNNKILNTDNSIDNKETAKNLIKSAYFQWILGYAVQKGWTKTGALNFVPGQGAAAPFHFDPLYKAIILFRAIDPGVTQPTLTPNENGALLYDGSKSAINETSIYGVLSPITTNAYFPTSINDASKCVSFYNYVTQEVANNLDKALDESIETVSRKKIGGIGSISYEGIIKYVLTLGIPKAPCSMYKGNGALCSRDFHKEYCVPKQAGGTATCAYNDKINSTEFCKLCRKDLCASSEGGSCAVDKGVTCDDFTTFIVNETPGASIIDDAPLAISVYQGICDLGKKDSSPPSYCSYNLNNTEPGCNSEPLEKIAARAVCNTLQSSSKCSNEHAPFCLLQDASCSLDGDIAGLAKKAIEGKCLQISGKQVNGVEIPAYIPLKKACQYQPFCIFDQSTNECFSVLEYAKNKFDISKEADKVKWHNIYNTVAQIISKLNSGSDASTFLNVSLDAIEQLTSTRITLDTLERYFTTINTGIQQQGQGVGDCMNKVCVGALGRVIYWYERAKKGKGGGQQDQVPDAVTSTMKWYLYEQILSNTDFGPLACQSLKDKGYKTDLAPAGAPLANLNYIVNKCIKPNLLNPPASATGSPTGNCGDAKVMDGVDSCIEAEVKLSDLPQPCTDYTKCLNGRLGAINTFACSNLSPGECESTPYCKYTPAQAQPASPYKCEPKGDITNLEKFCKVFGQNNCGKDTISSSLCEWKSGSPGTCTPKSGANCDAINNIKEPTILQQVCPAHQYTVDGATVNCKVENGRCNDGEKTQPSTPPQQPPPAQTCSATDPGSCNAIEGCIYTNECGPVNDTSCGFWREGDKCVKESNNKCAFCGGVCKAAASCGTGGPNLATELCPAKFSDCGTTPTALAACKDFGGQFNLDSNEQDKLEYAMILKERPVSTSFNPIDVCKWYGDEELKKRARLLKNELRYLVSSSNPWSHAGDWGQGAVDSYSSWAKEVMNAYKKVCDLLSKGGCSGQGTQTLTTAIDTIYMYLKECGIESARDPNYPRQLAHCADKAFSTEYECDKKAGTFVNELKAVQKSCRSATAKNCSDSGSLIKLVISLLESATGIKISAVCD